LHLIKKDEAKSGGQEGGVETEQFRALFPSPLWQHPATDSYIRRDVKKLTKDIVTLFT
jgi:hypothetical protein